MGAAGDRPPRPRWDPDERGIGVADARGHLAALDTLRDVAASDGWVAEAPETHLLPRITEAANEGASLTIVATTTEADGTFGIEARWVGEPDPEAWRVRATAIALIGAVAEATSLIHERRAVDGSATFDVVTGLLPDDTGFATHGHTLRLTVRTGA
jgi:hypothetical protein